MKKCKKIFYLFLMTIITACTLVFSVSCGDSGAGGKGDPVYTLDDVVFKDATFDYDGKEHSIFCENLPEGAVATYTNNRKVEPGEYTVVANIKTADNQRKMKNAKLTINFLSSELSAAAEQEVMAKSQSARFTYTLNNDEQEIVSIVKQNGNVVAFSSLYKVGVYDVEIYAAKSKHYSESNHVKLKLTVKESLYGVSFNDKSVVADGNPHQLTLDGTLPDGFKVEYQNNEGTTKGDYFATAIVQDSTGKTVETHKATLSIDNPDNAAFEAYLDQFFIEYLEGDQLSVNIFCVKPEDFGLSRYEAHWYTYSSFTDADALESQNNFTELLRQHRSFDLASLSSRQEIAYHQIEEFLEYQKDYYSVPDILFKENLYVDQFGGYVADFGTYMEAYTLREEADVVDIVDFILSTESAFASYVNYLTDKTAKGYGLSDYTLNAMLDYLKDVLDSQSQDGSSHYYLQDVLGAKVDAVEFLDATKKTNYKNQIATALAENFMNGVQALYEGVESFVGTLDAADEGYWASYEDGADLFQLELERLLGLEIDPTTYIKELEDTMREASMQASNALNTLIDKYGIKTQAQLDSLLSKAAIMTGTPNEMLEYLREFAKTIVPTLETTPEIVVKEMDMASAKVSNAVAYYMKSALDNDKLEYITLNPVKLGDKNDVLGTLSHEGYPGHLYAYVYSKQLNLHNISKIMTNTAHGEGWATYVELKLYEYAIAHSSDQKFIDVMNYLYYNQLSGFLFETRTDAGIHFQNWDATNVAAYMDQLGYNSSQAQEIYNLLIETPASYASYGYGKYFFVSLHNEAKQILGNAYDEIEFNAMLLSKGWTSLGELKNTYDSYMAKKCHKYGIPYSEK